METTKFLDDPTPGPLLRSQAIIYGLSTLLTVGLLVLGGVSWWHDRQAAPQAQAQTDPNSLGAGLSSVFQTWKREVWHSTPPPAPAIQPAQVQQATATPAPVAQVQVQDTPQPRGLTGRPRPADAAIEEPAAPTATPFPTPYLMPEVVADPVAARHSAWQSLHDAYVTQVRSRIAAAHTDAEKGQIRVEIERWQRMNPEPPKSAPATTGDEIPIH